VGFASSSCQVQARALTARIKTLPQFLHTLHMMIFFVYYRNTMHINVIIIGAGAAGLVCAIEAGKRGRSVIILDHTSKVGQKILISGGGRCNFTNLKIQPDNYLSANLHFCKSALARFTPRDFITLIEKHRISWREKEDGQIFCAGSSQQIVDILRKECDSAGVQFRLNCKIEEITKKSRFSVKTNFRGNGAWPPISRAVWTAYYPAETGTCTADVQQQRPGDLQRVERCLCQI